MTKIADASAACTMLRAIRAAALLHLHREASEEAKVSSPSPYTLPLALVLPLAPRPRPAHRAPPPPRPHPKQAGHLELACAAAWAKMHAAALKEVQAWEARVAAQVQLAAELRALSPDEGRSPAISPNGSRSGLDSDSGPPRCSRAGPRRRRPRGDARRRPPRCSRGGLRREERRDRAPLPSRALRAARPPPSAGAAQLPRRPPQPRCPPPRPVASASPPTSRLCLDPNLA